MGCNVVCPFVPNKFMQDWGLDDPSGGSIDGYRTTRDIIKQKVEELDRESKIKGNSIIIIFARFSTNFRVFYPKILIL